MSEPNAPVLPGEAPADEERLAQSANNYREPLPPGCPPADAVAVPAQTLLRLVPANPATPQDFDSSAALGYDCPPGCPACEWASCSVFLEGTRREKLSGMRKYPKLRNMQFIVKIAVTTNAGVARVTQGTGHVDLWMYDTFDPIAAIVGWEPLP